MKIHCPMIEVYGDGMMKHFRNKKTIFKSGQPNIDDDDDDDDHHHHHHHHNHDCTSQWLIVSRMDVNLA